MTTIGFVCRACKLNAGSASTIKSSLRPFCTDHREFSSSSRKLLPRTAGSFSSGWNNPQLQTTESDSNNFLRKLGVHPGLLQDFTQHDDSATDESISSAKDEDHESRFPTGHRSFDDTEPNGLRTRARPSQQSAEELRATTNRSQSAAGTAKETLSTQDSKFAKRPPFVKAHISSTGQQTTQQGSVESNDHLPPFFEHQNHDIPYKAKHPVEISLNGSLRGSSPLALRDLCTCERCIDPSTKQKLYNVADIPSNLQAKSIVYNRGNVHITWQDDLPGFPADHTTILSLSGISQLYSSKPFRAAYRPESIDATRWTDDIFRKSCQDMAYVDYMNDDHALFKALQQLLTHGLLFLTNVPETETSVSTIAERIGPIRETFYGRTWDVRSVPQAKNVAYTSQDLGFHMDLLYMVQPPHLQFLHCIRASNAGGASLFTDSHRAVKELWRQDPSAVDVLTDPKSVGFHYDHHPRHHYEQSHSVINGKRIKKRNGSTDFQINSVAWSPPFQMPLSHRPSIGTAKRKEAVEGGIEVWHDAAQKLNKLFHDPIGIYERLMKPGECVIFDNRRVLHARTAFQVGDMGKERWLRGCYLDKDPLLSRARTLGQRFPASESKRRPPK